MARLAPAPTRKQHMQASARQTVTEYDSLGGVTGDGALADQMTAGSGTKRRVSSVEHVHSPLVTVYDPLGNVRQVPAMNLNMVLDNGMDVQCPVCGGEHADDGPNQCPAREKLLQARCPICDRAIPEERVAVAARQDRPADDPSEFVTVPVPDVATREQQLLARVQMHATTYHPTQAFSRFGWRKPPEEK